MSDAATLTIKNVRLEIDQPGLDPAQVKQTLEEALEIVGRNLWALSSGKAESYLAEQISDIRLEGSAASQSLISAQPDALAQLILGQIKSQRLSAKARPA